MRLFSLTVLFAVAMIPVLGGCAVAQSRPTPPRPITEVAREERGQILTVRDTRIDLSTGNARSLRAHTPAVPVGPIGVRLPVQIGGEKRVEVPGEEITVQLASGKLISVVQQLSSPPFAPGERVRVLHERPSEISGVGRTQIVRE
jgi:hypothetical protein